jgi:inner membrane protein involved in colicin E2 resistance
MAALYLLFGVIYLVVSSKSDHLMVGGVFVIIALVYAGLARRAAQRGTAHSVPKD